MLSPRRAGGFAGIESLPFEQVTPESVLDAWDRIAMRLEDAYGPISLLNSVHPDAEVRDAGDRALIEESVFMTELFQNEQLFERVRRVVPRTTAQKQLQKDLLEAFEDSGVALPPEKRDRFKAISERLTELAQEFSKNIRENKTVLHFTPDECAGLPQSYLERVPRDGQGNIVVGFDYPDYVPFMANAVSEEARKRYYIANTNRGTPRNLEILDEIVALRKEIADLYEVPSYAHYVTKRRMVGNPETVTALSRRSEKRRHRGRAEGSAATGRNEVGADRCVDRGCLDRTMGRRLLPRTVARETLRGRSGGAARVLPDACRQSAGCSTSPNGCTASASVRAIAPCVARRRHVLRRR